MNLSKQKRENIREKFERWWEVNYHNGNPPRFGWDHWRDGDGYKTDDGESELDGMWQAWLEAHQLSQLAINQAWIDSVVPAIDPKNPTPIDPDKHQVEYALMKDRERIRMALSHLISGKLQ